MRNPFRWLAVALLSSTVLLSNVHGQTGTGAIVGTVQDSAGTALVSAKITVEPSARQAV